MINADELMLEIIDEIPTMTEAIRYCVRRSGLSDKLIYLELGIDAGNWSRIISGQASFPHERYLELFKICGNDLPLQWLARQRGYELKISKQSFEEQLEQERAEKMELQQKLDAIIDVLKRANIST